MTHARSSVVFFVVIAIFLSASLALGFEVKGLAMPQSFVVDKETGNYYISNIKGHAFSKNNNGFITMLSPDGKTANLKLVEGGKDGAVLNAPKGMMIIGNLIYVSDMRVVRTFDKSTGAKKDDIDLAPLNAKFLNGMTSGPDGRIYVSETVGNMIFAINPADGNKAQVFASGKGIESPNGITYDAGANRFLVTMGFGVLSAVGMDGKPQKLAKLPVKGLVGVDTDGEGNIYVSSFTRGFIYKLNKNLEQTVVAKNLVSPANLSLDRGKRLILVPLFLKRKAFTINY